MKYVWVLYIYRKYIMSFTTSWSNLHNYDVNILYNTNEASLKIHCKSSAVSANHIVSSAYIIRNKWIKFISIDLQYLLNKFTQKIINIEGV